MSADTCDNCGSEMDSGWPCPCGLAAGCPIKEANGRVCDTCRRRIYRSLNLSQHMTKQVAPCADKEGNTAP